MSGVSDVSAVSALLPSNLIHIGLDVDDTNYHGAALDKDSGECLSFNKCRPTLKGLLNQLNKLQKQFPGTVFHLCYEASYIGYTLQRDLSKQGCHCDVVAPTSIPSPRGKQIKTDRIDAAQLVQFYANGLLTLVEVPVRQAIPGVALHAEVPNGQASIF